MSKKNSSVILKEGFRDYKDISNIFSDFNKKLNSLKEKTFLIAVSGGPDSLALAALAKAYSYVSKCKIFYVLVKKKRMIKKLETILTIHLIIFLIKIFTKLLNHKKTHF